MSEQIFKFRWQEAVCNRGPDARGDLTPIERLVGLTASTWMDADGAGVRPGVSRLCDATGLKKRATVTTALKGLERKGYLECIHRGGRGLLGASVYVGRLPSHLGTVSPQAGHPEHLGLGTAAREARYRGGTPSVKDQYRSVRTRARGVCPECGVGGGGHAAGFPCTEAPS